MRQSPNNILPILATIPSQLTRMKPPSTTMAVTQKLAEAIAGYQPRKRVAFQDLLPFKEAIQDLRKRGASFLTIAEILRKHSVKTCHEAVRQFWHSLVEDDHVVKKPSRRRKVKRIRAKRSKAKTSVSPPPISETKPERGPRIARIEDL
jgi:hypothetical protein